MLTCVVQHDGHMFKKDATASSEIKKDPNMFVRKPGDLSESSSSTVGEKNQTIQTPVSVDNSKNSPYLQQAIDMLNRFNPPSTRFNVSNVERDEHFLREVSRQFYTQLYRLLGTSYRNNLSNKEFVEQIEVDEVFYYGYILSMPVVVSGGLLVVLGYIALILIYIWQHRRLQRQINHAASGKGALTLASTSASAVTRLTPAIRNAMLKRSCSVAGSATGSGSNPSTPVSTSVKTVPGASSSYPELTGVVTVPEKSSSETRRLSAEGSALVETPLPDKFSSTSLPSPGSRRMSSASGARTESTSPVEMIQKQSQTPPRTEDDPRIRTTFNMDVTDLATKSQHIDIVTINGIRIDPTNMV